MLKFVTVLTDDYSYLYADTNFLVVQSHGDRFFHKVIQGLF